MTTMNKIATAALAQDNLMLRGAVSDMLSECPSISDWPRPDTDDIYMLAVSASIAELVARHHGQNAPCWVNDVPSMATPIYLVKTAQTMRGVKKLCDEGSPEELRKRGFLAPPDFLKTV